MVIWGTRTHNKQVAEGRFFCPKCEADREYRHFQKKKSFTLYFIPLIPMGVQGEWWECGTCTRAYDPQTLPRKEPTVGIASQTT